MTQTQSPPITPDPPVPVEALVAAVPGGEKVASGPVLVDAVTFLLDEVQELTAASASPGRVETAELVERIRRLGQHRRALRGLKGEDIVRVLGEG